MVTNECLYLRASHEWNIRSVEFVVSVSGFFSFT